MAEITLRGNPIHTVGDLPPVGQSAPSFSLTKSDLSEAGNADFSGKRLVLNIFPSVDTAVCAMSVRTFNEKAAGLDGTVVMCVSADLPFAQNRFCGAEGIANVVMGSTFRNAEFGDTYGVRLADSGMRGLMARAVVVIDAAGVVRHTELVSEIAQEPNYEAALAALK